MQGNFVCRLIALIVFIVGCFVALPLNAALLGLAFWVLSTFLPGPNPQAFNGNFICRLIALIIFIVGLFVALPISALLAGLAFWALSTFF